MTEVVLEEAVAVSGGGKKEDYIKNIDHKGQGDGPCTAVEEAATSK